MKAYLSISHGKNNDLGPHRCYSVLRILAATQDYGKGAGESISIIRVTFILDRLK